MLAYKKGGTAFTLLFYLPCTVHFLGNLDSRKYRPEQDVCQNDRGDPPKRKTAFFQIFTDAISRNFAVTVQIGAIWRNLPFLTSRGIFGRPTIVNTIFRIEFRVYREIFSLLGAIRVKKMTSKRQRIPAKKDGFANYLPSLALSGVGPYWNIFSK